MGARSTTSRLKRNDVPFLEQTAGAGWGKTFELSRKRLSIGRTADNEIVLDSTSVSRVHAVLKSTPKGWFIEDNVSKNGIWVNGIAVKKSLLKPGDVVQVGEFVFRFCDPTQSSLNLEAREAPHAPTDNKTEVLSTDTWNVVPESLPKKPPIAHSDPFSPPVAARGPRRLKVPISNVGDHQERLYLTIGIAGGILIGSLLYLRQRHPTFSGPSDLILSQASKVESVTAQEAFRQIAEQGKGPSSSLESTDRSAPPTPIAPSTPPSPFTAAPVSQKAESAAIEIKELQMGPKAKHPRAASKDIGVYLAEGKAYLRDGDFESAALAYRFALVIDPNNPNAKAGLQAAEAHRKVVAPTSQYQQKREKAAEKKAEVNKYLKAAAGSLRRRRYQEAMEFAEKARRIELPGETAYLNEAKQILDRSAQRQKEEFEPFVELARKKMSQGDYRGSILLCEEMLRTDPGYAPAKECMERSTAGLATSVPRSDESPGGVR